MKQYNAQEIEKKWQKYWKENNLYKTKDNIKGKKNFYTLSEFAYPSGNLHVGHWYAFAVPDIYARYKRMRGYNVLYPIGFDSFGLPAENAAIKRGLDPKDWTYKNIDYMKNQLVTMGASFDWDREVITSNPEYYKWTQWMFTEFYKNGIVKRIDTKANWCDSCKTVLANEQVVSGKCDRCDTEVERKNIKQWAFKITDFADDLIDDLNELDWDESIKQSQREWIGRKEGSEIGFDIKSVNDKAVYNVIEKSIDVSIGQLEQFGKIYEKDDFDDWGKFYCVEVYLEKEESFISFMQEHLLVKNLDGGSWYIDSAGTTNKVIFHGKVIDVSTKEGLQEFYGYGKSLGIPDEQLDIDIKSNKKIKVFTTRTDTLFGVTYLVLAPEHQLIKKFKEYIENWDEVEAYLKDTEKKSELERQQGKEKTGVELKGVTVINPVNGEEIPVWVADYVLAHFGTGAVMAVPAHDERDAEFAIKYNLTFRFVVLPSAGEAGKEPELILHGETDFIKKAGEGKNGQEKIQAEWNAFYDLLNNVHEKGGILPIGNRISCPLKGRLINSNHFNRIYSDDAVSKILDLIGGKIKKTYRLRDWAISRQRYWGTPIPIVYDVDGNPHIIPEEHLPWKLPEDVDYKPDGTPPLARSKELKERTEKIFGKGWAPEVDTMDTFVDSSWYFYRYLDTQNNKNFVSKEVLKKWMPVDIYFGGAEHTTMHLLYSRFWVKALYKIGLVLNKEPYIRRLNRGLILGPDGVKMSKSKGNVIDPDEVVSHVGADAVRMYLAFIGPFNEPGNYPWDPNGVVGVRRFIERFYSLSENIFKEESSKELEKITHQTIKKAGEDIERLKFNTAISSLMQWLNFAEKEEKVGMEDFKKIIKIFSIFAPHIAEEIWQEILLENESIHLSSWPEYIEEIIQEDKKKIAVQVNGKVRGEILLSVDAEKDFVKEKVMSMKDIQKWVDGKEVKKLIYIKGKIINIVI